MNTLKKMIAVTALMTAFALPAHAEEAAKSYPFGVVDMVQVVLGSEAAKALQAEMIAKEKEFSGEIMKDLKSLKQQEMDFNKQKDTLSKEDAQKKFFELQKKDVALQKLDGEKRAILNRVKIEATTKTKVEAAKVASEIAKEKGFSAVLTQDAVMISLPEMDITAEVIKRMNEKVKKISVDWTPPAVEAPKKAEDAPKK